MGNVKTGGRRAGTPNRRTRDLLDMIRGQFPNYHPVLAMCAIATDESLSMELRFAAHREVAQYVAPKRKAVELETTDESATQVRSIVINAISISPGATESTIEPIRTIRGPQLIDAEAQYIELEPIGVLLNHDEYADKLLSASEE
jgi:hypothetical protein